MSNKKRPGTILSIKRAAERLGGLCGSTVRNFIGNAPPFWAAATAGPQRRASHSPGKRR